MHAARRVAVRRAPTVFGASARRTYSLEVFNNSSSILGEGALWHASSKMHRVAAEVVVFLSLL